MSDDDVDGGDLEEEDEGIIKFSLDNVEFENYNQEVGVQEQLI